MSQQTYVGTYQRTFQAAFVHEMESNYYGFLKSRRMLSLLAEDVQRLIDKFYPLPQYLRPGWILFTGTKADRHKARPGQHTCEFTAVAIPWPLLLPEDLAWMSTHRDTAEQRRPLLKQRLMRLIEHGADHPLGPVLLTLSDLALLISLTSALLRHCLQKPATKPANPYLPRATSLLRACALFIKPTSLRFMSKAGTNSSRTLLSSRPKQCRTLFTRLRVHQGTGQTSACN